MGFVSKARRFVTDWFDYESKGKTPQRFGDTKPQLTPDDQNYELLGDLYRKNGLVHKVVAKPAHDATRNGWRLVIKGDPEKQAKYQKAMDKLGLKKACAQELIYQRLDGDGYLNVGVNEINQTDLTKPLDTANIKSIAWVHPFGQKHVKAYYTNNDPSSDDYGKESAAVINQTQPTSNVDKQGNILPEPQKLEPIVIDKSRYFHISLDKMEDNLTGTSIITRCYDSIKVLDSASYSTGKIFYEYVLKVLNSSHLANESQQDFNKDYFMLSQGMDTESLVVLDENEHLQKISTNTSGINSLYDFAWQSLSATSEIPKSILTGEQAGTLAGASQDVINYYDNVKAIQEDILRPQLEQIVRLLMWATDVADGSEDPDTIDWHIEFKPLWSDDDSTQSKTFATYTGAICQLVTAGIYDTDEAKQLLASLSNNNVSGMQDSYTADSADDTDLTPEQLEQYKKELEKAKENAKT